MENKRRERRSGAAYVQAFRERTKATSSKLDTWIKPQNKDYLKSLSEEMNKPMKEVVDLLIEDHANRRRQIL
ncbi:MULTISPECIES: hypothetical protein [Serratia]|uniref:hypothetical protein n=1 Tax=Serratia TaxID=613 RepID=UPI001602F21A|nr:hypothetical protein [Serratia sp. OS31]MBB1584604.1 hypothetical protein [Serratia sp. OS31]